MASSSSSIGKPLPPAKRVRRQSTINEYAVADAANDSDNDAMVSDLDDEDVDGSQYSADNDRDFEVRNASAESSSSSSSSSSEEGEEDDEEEEDCDRPLKKRHEAMAAVELAELTGVYVEGTPVVGVAWNNGDLELEFRVTGGTAKRVLADLASNDDDAAILDDLSFDQQSSVLEWEASTIHDVVRCLLGHLQGDRANWLDRASRRKRLVPCVHGLLVGMYGVGYVGYVAHHSSVLLRWLACAGATHTNVLDLLDNQSWPVVVRTMSSRALAALAAVKPLKLLLRTAPYTLVAERLATYQASTDDAAGRAERWLITMQALLGSVPPGLRAKALASPYIQHLDASLCNLSSVVIHGLDVNDGDADATWGQSA